MLASALNRAVRGSVDDAFDDVDAVGDDVVDAELLDHQRCRKYMTISAIPICTSSIAVSTLRFRCNDKRRNYVCQ